MAKQTSAKKAASKKSASTVKKASAKKAPIKKAPALPDKKEKDEKPIVDPVMSKSVKGLLTKTKNGLIKVDQGGMDRSDRFKKKKGGKDASVQLFGFGYFELLPKKEK